MNMANESKYMPWKYSAWQHDCIMQSSFFITLTCGIYEPLMMVYYTDSMKIVGSECWLIYAHFSICQSYQILKIWCYMCCILHIVVILKDKLLCLFLIFLHRICLINFLCSEEFVGNEGGNWQAEKIYEETSIR